MKKQNRKGFTIVELVIVIAVIAILSAVLIPTFGSIIDSANKAADTQLVAQINTVLAIEDVLGGGVNDAVEIQKIVKENGLKLQTKFKGQYIWYDIENKKAVLGGLDENGIVLEGAAAEPALVDEGEGVVSSKGKFRAIVNSPESFVNGYLFISTESADGFAQDICALRNSDSVDAIQNALANISEVNSVLGVKLTNFMKTAAVITGNGSVITIGDASTVKTAIVNSELTHVESSTITALSQYTGIQVVDFHSVVASFGEGVMDAIKALNDTKFCYSNTGVEEIDKADEAATGIKNNLISPTERDELFKKLNLVYIDQNGVQFDEEKNIDEIEVSDDFITTFTFPYVIVASNNIDAAYDFVAYSFYSDGSNPIPSGTTNYKIEDYDKILSDEESGTLTIYAVYNKQTADFKVGNSYYGSETVTYMFDSGLITSGTVVTVVSTTATLGDDTHNEITIPNGVTLHLPYYTDVTNKIYSTSTSAKDKNSVTNGSTYSAVNKLTTPGNSRLTIADGVTLKNEGTIYVDAQLYYAGTNTQCYVKDVCGVLVVDGTLESVGTLYAYGVVRGQGEIVASEGLVTEVFTILDWPGGTIGSNNIAEKVTPFNNWLADNIRAKMTLKKGVKYSAFGAVDLSVVGTQAMELVLVDDNTSTNPLFVMEGADAEVQKTYGDSYELSIIAGTVKDTKKEISVSTYTIKFYEMAMPLPNFDITVKAGAALELNNNLYKVLPGSEVVVEEAKDGKEAGKLTINTAVAFYDSFDLKMIEYYKANQTVSVDVGRVTINSCTYSDNLKSLTLTGKYGWSTSTGSCVVITYSVANYDGTTSLMNNGNLVFGENAKFTGDIESTVEGAKIEINANAKFENKTTVKNTSGTNIPVHGFKEGVAATVKLNVLVGELPISFYQPTYDANVDLTGNFRVDLDYSQIPTGEAIYTYNGSIWTK